MSAATKNSEYKSAVVLRDGKGMMPGDRDPPTHGERLFRNGGAEEPSKELRRTSRLEKFGVKPR